MLGLCAGDTQPSKHVINSFGKMHNKTDYTNPFLVQDECAPDAMEYFEKEFIEKMGMTVKEFKAKALKIEVDDGYGFEWLWTNEGFHYCLSIEAGDPFYKLYKTEIA
jgi:hypothetical protein